MFGNANWNAWRKWHCQSREVIMYGVPSLNFTIHIKHSMEGNKKKDPLFTGGRETITKVK
jgi:hypothetical protein